MIVNPTVKMIYKEIAAATVSHGNSTDKDRKYHRRLVKIFKENFNEEEQIYLLKLMFEQLSYKNIITDPDNIITLHNIKLRSYTYLFFLTVAGMIVASILFKTNESIGSIVTVIQNVLKMLSI